MEAGGRGWWVIVSGVRCGRAWVSLLSSVLDSRGSCEHCLCLHSVDCSEHAHRTIPASLVSITCFHVRCSCAERTSLAPPCADPLTPVLCPSVRSAPHWGVVWVFIISGVSALLNASQLMRQELSIPVDWHKIQFMGVLVRVFSAVKRQRDHGTS